MKKFLLGLLGFLLSVSTVLAVGSVAGPSGGVGSQAGAGWFLDGTTVRTFADVTSICDAGDRCPQSFFDSVDTLALVLGGAVAGDVHINDDFEVTFGNTFAAPDVRLGWNTAQTVDALYLGLSTAQNTFVIGELGDIAFDFAHGAQTNPTLFGHSAAQSTTQWWSLTHNQTDTVFASGAGNLTFNVVASAAHVFNFATTPVLTMTDSADGAAAGSVFNFAHTRTDTAAANRQPFLSVFTFNPAAESATSLVGHTYQLQIPAANGFNFTSATGLYAWRTIFSYLGTGTVTLGNAANSGLAIGATSTLTEGYGWAVNTPTTTGGTYVNVGGIQIRDQSLAGGTTAFGLVIESQTANATTTRAIELEGTGVNNAIRLGSSANLYGSAAETVRFTDSTDVNGLSLVFAATASQTINTISATTGVITFQNQTFTAGVAHNAVQVTPTWAAENFGHVALRLAPTQNGANSSSLTGLNVVMTKATGATVLDAMVGISVQAPTIAGTVSTGVGIDIADQTNVGFTSVAAIRTVGTGTSNAIVLGNSPRIFSSGADVIDLFDATSTAGLQVTLTAAGDQTFTTTVGDLLLNIAGANLAPSADNGTALGISGQAFADLFLASGAVINFSAADVTLTHAAGQITLAGDMLFSNDARLTGSSVFGLGTDTELTIDAGGAIVPVRSYHSIDTFADGASDNLDTITATNFSTGDILIIRANNDARTVVVRHIGGGTGNIRLNGSVDNSLDNANDKLMLLYDGANFVQIGVGNNGA